MSKERLSVSFTQKHFRTWVLQRRAGYPNAWSMAKALSPYSEQMAFYCHILRRVNREFIANKDGQTNDGITRDLKHAHDTIVRLMFRDISQTFTAGVYYTLSRYVMFYYPQPKENNDAIFDSDYPKQEADNLVG